MRASDEHVIQMVLAILDLLDRAPIRSLPHPLGARRWRPVRPIVIGAELPMEAGKAMVRAAHQSTALHLVAEAVAVSARKQSARAVELRDLPTAIHAVG